MSDQDNNILIQKLFTEIKRALVDSSAIAFSENKDERLSLTMWTGGASRDNRIGSLSLTFREVHDGRIKISVDIKQQNLKTKKHSKPMAGEYYLDDQKFYKRLNEVLSRFGGRELPRRIPSVG